jgi:peptide deformylase
MAILDIIHAPAKVLSTVARPVRENEFGALLSKLTSDMAETMYAAPGVGLAAPQIGDSRRIVVIDSGSGEEKGRRLFKMVNPTIIERSEQRINWDETCLSVPDLEVRKDRANIVRVTWQQPDGTAREETFEAFEAVIVQHELDHLNGVVLLDVVSNLKRRRYINKQKKLGLL